MDLVLVPATRRAREAAAGDPRHAARCGSRCSPPTCRGRPRCSASPRRAGEVDMLVNNAGAIPPGNLLAVDNDTWRRAWDLKVFGFISLCRADLSADGGTRRRRDRQRDRRGRREIPPGYIAGAAGNAALMAFTRALGHASQKDGIRVVGINPGAVATERMERAAAPPRRDRTRRRGAWRELLRRPAVRPRGRPRGDRRRRGLPGQPAQWLYHRNDPDHRWRSMKEAVLF